MNREKLIEDMARGIKALKAVNDGVFDPVFDPTPEEIEYAAYALAIAEPRIAEEWKEKAAKKADVFAARPDGCSACSDIAAAIRAMPTGDNG